MNIVPNQTSFTHYPVDHVIGILRGADHVDQLCGALEGLGFTAERVKVFQGEEGRAAFDNNERGLQGWWERTSSSLTGTRQDKLAYLDALTDGQYIVAADLHGQLERRDAVGEAFRASGGQDVNHMGAVVVDNLG